MASNNGLISWVTILLVFVLLLTSIVAQKGPIPPFGDETKSLPFIVRRRSSHLRSRRASSCALLLLVH
ncbi:hypothetical protein ACOSQ4_027457 [Xanthoceras sorbifolium]